MSSEAPALVHPTAVFAAYLEALVAGRRVVVLGEATTGLAEALLDRGARVVHAYDPDAGRISEALTRAVPGVPSPTYAVLAGDLGVRDGAFDLAIVPDLSIFSDPAELLRRARRLVGHGVAVVASPNPAAAQRLTGQAPPSAGAPLDYYALYDAVTSHFPRVRMLGQAPFVGYTLADFAPDGEPEVAVDTSLLEGSEEPEAFIAVASERPVSIEPYAVVELPLESVAGALGGSDEPTTLRPDRLAMAETEARLALVSAELETMRDKTREQAREAESRASNTTALSARVVELERELEQRTARLRDVEGRAGDAHVRAERVTHQVRDLEEELRRQRDRGVTLSKQLDDEKKARTKAELDLGMLRGRPEIAGGKDRIDALAAELDQARARIAELEMAETETRRRVTIEPVVTDDAARIAQVEASLDAAAEAARQAAFARVAVEAQLEGVRKELDGERRGKGELAEENRLLAERLDEKNAGIARLEAKLSDIERRMDFARADTAATADLDALERALAERGHVVRALQRDLRETERVGRELLQELEELRGAALEPSPAPPPPSEPPAPIEASGRAPQASAAAVADPDLRHRLDTLAAAAARAEADLQAASWRIAELERKLVAAARPRPHDSVQLELEQALVAAREEVATLRRALSRADAG